MPDPVMHIIIRDRQWNRALCSCGWTGPGRFEVNGWAADAEEHYRTAE